MSELKKTVEQWADFWRFEVGVNVIPANTKYKKPIVTWTEWQNTPIPDEIHEQWKRDGTFRNGMAIVCGKVWHNSLKNGLYLCAIDLDNQRAIDEIMPQGMKFYAEKTLVEWHKDNSTKCHLYFYTHNPVTKKSSDKVSKEIESKLNNNEIPALEVKGDGKHGIMYVTPSPHKAGNNYEIVGVSTPVILDEVETMIEGVCKKYNISYLSQAQNGNSLIPMNDLLNDDAKICEGHNRHLAMLRYACHVYKTSPSTVTDKIVFGILTAKNQTMCKPSLEKEEIIKLQEQAKNKVEQWNKENNENAIDKKVKNPKINDLIDELMETWHFITMEDTDEIYYYLEGVYVLGGEIIIKKQAEQMISNLENKIVSEILGTIRRRSYTPRKDFDVDLHMLNLKNLWLDIETGKIYSHTPTRLSKVQIPIFYDPTKTSVNFNKFLRQCLTEPTDVYTVYEQFASCLMRTAKFSKAFMHIGQGSNGKSVYLNVIKRCLGYENISHVSIHSIEENRFAPASLDGKLANMYADISNEELNSAGTFKNIVTGDPVQVEKKNKAPFDLINYAKMFFSANQIPIVYDESDGFFRRFMIIEWNVKFTDKGEDNTVKANENLLDELTTEEEKSGILNMLISIAKKLNLRGYYKYADSTEVLRTKWQHKADSVGGFLEHGMIYDDDLEVEKTRLYNSYMDYCKENKLMPMKRKKFQEEVKHNSPLHDDGIPVRIDTMKVSWNFAKKMEGMDGKSVRVWHGGMVRKDSEILD
jgi:putative DNA primase/helicase